MELLHFAQMQKLWSFTLSSASFSVSFDFVFLFLTRDSSSKLSSPLARLLLTVVKVGCTIARYAASPLQRNLLEDRAKSHQS